jgi:hypothetical protein
MQNVRAIICFIVQDVFLFTDPNAFTYNDQDVLVLWSCQIQHSGWLYALLTVPTVPHSPHSPIPYEFSSSSFVNYVAALPVQIKQFH